MRGDLRKTRVIPKVGDLSIVKRSDTDDDNPVWREKDLFLDVGSRLEIQKRRIGLNS